MPEQSRTSGNSIGVPRHDHDGDARSSTLIEPRRHQRRADPLPLPFGHDSHRRQPHDGHPGDADDSVTGENRMCPTTVSFSTATMEISKGACCRKASTRSASTVVSNAALIHVTNAGDVLGALSPDVVHSGTGPF